MFGLILRGRAFSLHHILRLNVMEGVALIMCIEKENIGKPAPSASNLRITSGRRGITMSDDRERLGDLYYEAWRTGRNPDLVSDDDYYYRRSRGFHPDEIGLRDVYPDEEERDESV